MKLLILLLFVLLGLIAFTVSLIHTGNWRISLGHACLTLGTTVLGLSLLITLSRACRDEPFNDRIELPKTPTRLQ